MVLGAGDSRLGLRSVAGCSGLVAGGWLVGPAFPSSSRNSHSLASRQSRFTVSVETCRTSILALAMAHEIGHLLLPPPSHSTSGIKRPLWDGDDIRHAVLGQLTFTSAQSSLIRKKVVGCRCDQRLKGAK